MVTYLGPLTTTFTPPSQCLNGNTLFRNAPSADVHILDKPGCYPTKYEASGYYSPGFFCPVGYQASKQNDGIETTLNCCPNKFQYTASSSGICVHTDLSTTFSVFITASAASSARKTISTQYYSTQAAVIWAEVIQLRYKSSDLVISTTTTTTKGSSTNLAAIGSSASKSDSTPAITETSQPLSSLGPTRSTGTTGSTLSTGATGSTLQVGAIGTTLSTGATKSNSSMRAKVAIGIAYPSSSLAPLQLSVSFWFGREESVLFMKWMLL